MLVSLPSLLVQAYYDTSLSTGAGVKGASVPLVPKAALSGRVAACGSGDATVRAEAVCSEATVVLANRQVL